MLSKTMQNDICIYVESGGLLKMLTIAEFVWKVWAGPLYNAFKTQTNYFHTIMWKMWEKMLFRC